VAEETAGPGPHSGVTLSLLTRGDGFVLMRATVDAISPPIVLRALRMADCVILNIRASENPGLALTPPLKEASVPLERGYVARLAQQAGHLAAAVASRAVAAIAAEARLVLPAAPGAAAALHEAARHAGRVVADGEPARLAAAAEVHAALYFTLRHAQQAGLAGEAAAQDGPA
jgi:hypothetical protein